MKSFILFVLSTFFLLPFPVNAGNDKTGISIGIHGVYTNGGDLGKKDLGVGGHILLPITENFLAELSLTQFQDGEGVVSVDVTTAALTLYYEILLNDRVKLSLGGGVNHTQFEGEISIPGFRVDIEDTVGVHSTIGLRTLLSEDLGLFGGYRHTWAKSHAEVWDPYGNCEVVTGRYRYGMFMLMVDYRF